MIYNNSDDQINKSDNYVDMLRKDLSICLTKQGTLSKI
jgi:hypothetical protein